MDILKCNRWQQPRLHILFALPMETVENSPARFPQSVHWKERKNLWISSSATDGSNRAFIFSSRCPWRLLRIPLHGCRNLCTGKKAKTMHIFKCNRWQQPRLHILFPLPMETVENSPARLPQSVHWKASKNYGYLQVQQMAATAPSHSLPVCHGDY